ncbi:hypothetical protein I6B53_07595 [Schaalia sp. 19OD2882]|uniref:hypothetical protein n=1 Tax=Schaalia sp. 19OD2882 TaxID=2794089 RepID=UPI001C1EB42A|nr:hypothetical protein [Schaalia sp. 19OD2882]QWW18997.1 hypothetical protein I6B53_07595 [Schaalia sp. 19OD2882]
MEPHPHIIRTTGTLSRSLSCDGEVVRLRRGYHLRIPRACGMAPWDLWDLVARARAEVTVAASKQRIVLVNASALVAHGLTGWVRNPDVHVSAPQTVRRTRLPAVHVNGVTVPEVVVRQTRVDLGGEVVDIDGILAESLEDTAIRMALTCEPLEAFVAVCAVLAHRTSFTPFDLDSSRHAEAEVRARMLARLDGLDSARGWRRAKEIVLAADAGCQNPGEAALLWALKSSGRDDLRTQFEVRIDGQRYFIDIADQRRDEAFEFDGIGKLGKDQAEFHRAVREQMVRQRTLERNGWKVTRIGWEDFEDFERLRNRVGPGVPSGRRLRWEQHRSGLWAPPSCDCDGPRRRFHVPRPGARAAC